MAIILFALAFNDKLTLAKVIMEMRALVYVMLNVSCHLVSKVFWLLCGYCTEYDDEYLSIC